MKNLIITENQYRFLLENDAKQGIYQYLYSGDPNNIKLAIQLAKGQNIDISEELNEFKNFADFHTNINVNQPIMGIIERLYSINEVAFNFSQPIYPKILVTLRNVEQLGTLWADYELTSIPKVFGQMPWVKALSIDKGHLTDIPPEIKNLNQLSILSLSKNKKLGFHPMITQLTSIEQLFLQMSGIKAIPEEIGNLKNLEGLFIAGNPDMDQQSLLNLAKLPKIKLLLLPTETDPKNVETLKKMLPKTTIATNK